jgi:hypothetical protein
MEGREKEEITFAVGLSRNRAMPLQACTAPPLVPAHTLRRNTDTSHGQRVAEILSAAWVRQRRRARDGGRVAIDNSERFIPGAAFEVTVSEARPINRRGRGKKRSAPE